MYVCMYICLTLPSLMQVYAPAAVTAVMVRQVLDVLPSLHPNAVRRDLMLTGAVKVYKGRVRVCKGAVRVYKNRVRVCGAT